MSIEIAHKARLRPIERVAEEPGIPPDHFIPPARHEAKIRISAIAPRQERRRALWFCCGDHADAGRRGCVDDPSVNRVRLFAGAGFVVAICGDIGTMPGLPRRPRRR